MTKFEEKRIKIGVLEELNRQVEQNIKYVKTDYRPVETLDEQDTDWQGNLKFDSDGNPVMKKRWGYVDKEESEFTEEDKLKISYYEEIQKYLEKQI